MTGQEMFEAIVRHRFPLLPEERVAKMALEYWEASRDCSLHHVYDAYDWMRIEQIATGGADDPEPESPANGDRYARRAAGGVEQLEWFGSGWRRVRFVDVKERE